MINSKLIKILKSFDTTEWGNFKKFSSSSYFSKGRNYSPVLIVLEKFYPEFDNEDLTMELIYEDIFPGKPFNKNVINVVLSGLSSLAESFLIINEIEKKPHKKNMLLNDAFLERGKMKLFDSGFKNSLKILDKEKVRNNDYWYYRYKFESQNNRKKMLMEEATYYFDDKFIESEQILYYYFLHEMCRFYQPALDPDFMFETSFKENYLFNYLINELERNIDTGPKTLRCYYYYFKLILTRQREYFDKLFKSFKKIEDEFETSELRDFYITLLNYLGYSYNKNNSSLEEYFEIMDILIKRNLLQRTDGYIEPNSLVNLVSIMKKDNADSVYDFIAKNYERLAPNIRNSTYNYCKGVIDLKKGNYEESLKHLSKVEPFDYIMKLNADLYRFSIFYDLKYFENALSLCESVVKYLQYHKEISKDMKPHYYDFINCYKQLIKINSTDHNDTDIHEFKKLIESKKNLYLKAWFLKKTEELK